MGVICGIGLFVIGGACWWLNSAGANVTIYDPMLSTVVTAGSVVCVGLGILFFIMGAFPRGRK